MNTNMASCSRAVWRAVSGCRRLSAVHPLHSALSQTPLNTVPVRTLAGIRTRKTKKELEIEEEEKLKKELEEKKQRKLESYRSRLTRAPVDNVYIQRYYPRKRHGVEEAIELLKTYNNLDFTPTHQPFYIDLRLDMKLEKKKKVDHFISLVHLPHPIKTENNKVLVFTEDPTQVKEAQEHGAFITGGGELVEQILDDKITADFYLAVPEILPKLTPLKNKLRKKFPKSSRGFVGVNIPKMVNQFISGHEYTVEQECFVRSQIAMLDMPTEHIMENIRAFVTDVCTHRPAHFGPFVEKAVFSSQTSEGLWVDPGDLLPKTSEEEETEENMEAQY